MTKLPALLASAAFALTALVATPASAANVIGGTTDVTLTAAPTLAGLGLSAAPTGTATVTTTAGIPTFTFPITGGTINDSTGAALINHDGSGILFSAGTSTLQIGNFLIDTAAAQVFGSAVINGSTTLTGVPLFTIGTGTSLSLTSQAAGAFTSVFGAPDLTGVNVGFARVNAVTAAVPEPATWGLMLLGFGVVGYGLRRRRSAGQLGLAFA